MIEPWLSIGNEPDFGLPTVLRFGRLWRAKLAEPRLSFLATGNPAQSFLEFNTSSLSELASSHLQLVKSSIVENESDSNDDLRCTSHLFRHKNNSMNNLI